MTLLTRQQLEHNKELNEQLRKVIEKNNYDKVRELISNDKLLFIDDETFRILFSNYSGLYPEFSSILRDDSLQDIAKFFMEHVPSKFLCVTKGKIDISCDPPCVSFIFKHEQDLIQKLLKTVSELGRDDVVVTKKDISLLERKIENLKNDVEVAYITSSSSNEQDCHDAMNAIKKYCVEKGRGKYEIVPYYLLPIKDQSRELKQGFKDTFNAIDSGNIDKVKEGLEVIKGNVPKGDQAAIYGINKALNMLTKKAESNEGMVRAIADITFPGTDLEEGTVQSLGTKGPQCN